MLGRTSVRSLGSLALIALLAVAVGLWSQSTAGAQPTPTPCPAGTPGCSDTHITVGGGAGQAPVIECKWELPDMDSVAPGIQYVDSSGNHDDAATMPTPLHPCDQTGSTPPTMANGAIHMIQVAPNLENLPSQRLIQLWAAVDQPQNVTNLYWDVWEPEVNATTCPDTVLNPTGPDVDGWCKKAQVHAIGPSADPATAGKIADPDCALLGAVGTDAAGSMFEAAQATGQLSSAAVNNTSYGMKIKCQQGSKALYYAQFPLSKDQPCGQYKVVLKVENTIGAAPTLTNYLDVLCTFGLQIDFDRVNWASIGVGTWTQQDGDFNWDALHVGTNNDPNPPTVKNVGNDDMGLKVTFHAMTGETTKDTIRQFDACFLGQDNANLLCFGKDGHPAVWAEDVIDFGSAPSQVLCANELGKLDLSVHTKTNQSADTYDGTVDVLGYAPALAPPGDCAGNHHTP